MTWDKHYAEILETRADREMAGLEPLPKIYISFSGGRTSAVMTKRLWEEVRDTHEAVIIFANTGCEHPATLDFVFQCECAFDWPVAWVEAVVDPRRGKGVGHKLVNYQTASRNGEPFADVVAKYGIFNQTNPACTNRTKIDPIQSLLRELGYRWGRGLNHQVAIGIRADEFDRMSAYAMQNRGAIYPMVKWGMTKADVGREIKTWGFDLRIPGDHYGNCTWCWKKSLRKHLTLALESPEVFDFPRQMEEQHGKDSAHRKCSDDNGYTWWFRKNRSVGDIMQLAKDKEFTPYSDDPVVMGWTDAPVITRERTWEAELNMQGACGESCEIFADEAWITASDDPMQPSLFEELT